MIRRLRHAWCAFFSKHLTKQQMTRLAHELGMHNLDSDCALCFADHVEAYIAMCTAILTATQHADRIAAFEVHFRRLASGGPPNRMLLHEHPAYMLAEFLNIDHRQVNAEFEALLEQTTSYKRY